MGSVVCRGEDTDLRACLLRPDSGLLRMEWCRARPLVSYLMLFIRYISLRSRESFARKFFFLDRIWYVYGGGGVRGG